MSSVGEDRPSSRAGPSWIEISLEAPADAEEDLAALLCDAGASGVRVEMNGDVVVLHASFADPATCPSEKEIRDLIHRAPGSSAAARLVSVVTLADERWAERWIAALAPFPVGERLVVVPVPDLDEPSLHREAIPPASPPDRRSRSSAAMGSAERDRPPEGSRRIPIRICPSRAFGTGEHATTRMCLEALESLPLEGRSLLDVGTGSGILAVAGAKLGCSRIVALDTDPEAIGVAGANLRLNGLTAQVDLLCGETHALAPSRFDVVVANLNGFILTSVLPELLRRVAPAGALILSGLLESEAPGIAERASGDDLPFGRVIRREGWACVVREGARG